MEELQEKLQQALKSGGIPVAGPLGAMLGTAQDQQGPDRDQMDADANETLQKIRHFNFKPRDIRDYLNRFVVKQQEAKKVLSVAICDHYNHVRQCIENPQLRERDYHKQNILLLGPTGVGKTYLLRTIAKLIGVPFVKADATKFSETGYVGSDVEDLVRDLYKMSGNNAELAQYGIIYIDEIDKIATSGNTQGKDVSGRGVQINLLKLMEDADVNLFSPTDMMAQMSAMMEASRGGKPRQRTLNTRHILFIVSGAFDKLGESVKKRMEAAAVGFGGSAANSERDASDYLGDVSTTDFIKYGFEPEFIGRLPVRVACEQLTADDLSAILTASEGNLLEQYRMDFKGYGIDFAVTKEAVQEIALRAHREKTGARGLMTVFERVFRYFKFELPSTGVQAFEVTRETVINPTLALKNLLKASVQQQRAALLQDVQDFAARFRDLHGLELSFSAEACETLIDASIDTDKTVRTICEERFKDFEHGLKIIARNTGKQSFDITKAMVEKPDQELSQWVVDSFRERTGKQESQDA